MTNPDEIVYCLACHKPMMAQDAVCPSCGADQNALRAQQLQGGPPPSPPPPAPPPQYGYSPGQPPAPQPGVFACPQCHGPYPAGARYCPNCGYSAYTGQPVRAQDATTDLVLGYLFAVISLGFCPV